MCTILGVRTSTRLARMSGSAWRRKRRPWRTAMPALEQEGPDLIDDGGALADQARTNPMQRLQIELVDTLGGHESHGGTLHRLGYGFGVAEVVLLALEEGLHGNCPGTSF